MTSDSRLFFGWDISTSIIGLAIFDESGKLIKTDHLDLRKIEKDLIDKSFEAERWVQEIANSVEIVNVDGEVHETNCVHFVEDRLGSFAPGKTMQQVLLKLAAFNATVSYIICRAFWDRGLDNCVEHIHPSTVKSIVRKMGLVVPKGGDKKEITLSWVREREPTFEVDLNKNGNPQPWCYDRADAYITGLAGYRRSYLSLDAQGKKATDPTDLSGP